MVDELGTRFAEALGRKDAATLRSLLRPDVDFRGMTPRDFWESHSADDVVGNILLGKWFEPSDDITGFFDIQNASVGSRQRVGYRFTVSSGGQNYVGEQQAYFQAVDGQISWLRIMCAGFQPTT